MALKKWDYVIHPDRLRILQALMEEDKTIDEISKELKMIPQSSIYRHVNSLHESKIIKIAKTVRVRGTSERIYQIKGQKLRGFMRDFKREFKDLLAL